MATLEIILLVVGLSIIGIIIEVILLIRKFLLERIRKVSYLYSDNSWSGGRWSHWKYLDSYLIGIIKRKNLECMSIVGNGIGELPNNSIVFLERKELQDIYSQEDRDHPFIIFRIKNSKRILVRYFESISKDGFRTFYCQGDHEVWELWEPDDIEILGTISDTCIEE